MAIKLTEFFQRRPGMSSEAFLTHWQQQHTGVVSAIEGLRRYIQNPAAGLLENAAKPYDGMVEVWFDDLAAIERIQKSDYWDTIVEDELRFVDRPTLQLFYSEEPLPERPTAGWKRVYLLHHLPGQTREEFRRAFAADPASPPAGFRGGAGLAGFLGVERLLPLDAGRTGVEPCADALEIWRFETRGALEAGFKDEAVARVCEVRGRWAAASEPMTSEERVIR